MNFSSTLLVALIEKNIFFRVNGFLVNAIWIGAFSIVALTLITLWIAGLFEKSIDITKEEVGLTIRQRLNGHLNDKEWDDFLHGTKPSDQEIGKVLLKISILQEEHVCPNPPVHWDKAGIQKLEEISAALLDGNLPE